MTLGQQKDAELTSLRRDLRICLDALVGLKGLCQNARWEDEVMRLTVESVVMVALRKVGRHNHDLA